MDKLIITDQHQLEAIISSSIQKALVDFLGQETETENDFLNLKDTAKFLDLATQTIYGLTCRREIPFYKKGKKLYFKKSELEKWLEDGRKSSQDELKQGYANCFSRK